VTFSLMYVRHPDEPKASYPRKKYEYETEAERAASVKSDNSGMRYQVVDRQGNVRSEWYNGNKLPKNADK
jgi:hypothetical protein